MPRLGTLLCAGNRIAALDPALSAAAPALHSLVLSNNALASLAALEPLAGFPALVRLSLRGCPVTRRPYYREWLLHRLPSLRVLDFQRVTDVVGPLSFCLPWPLSRA
jgi:U2 small nuclear ribonucleoprotein A'